MRRTQAFLQHQVRTRRTPCVQYAIFDARRVHHQYSEGVARVAGNEAAADDTSFHLYSVTKTFTALAVLQLVEEGTLDLDSPARQYLSSFPYGGAITLRHLLTHTAGLPNPIPLGWIHLASEHTAFDRDAFFDAVFARHPRTRSAPGQQMAYSNLGFVLLGRILEAVTGERYEDLVTGRILQRLPLQSGDLAFTVHDPAHHARGYQKQWSLTNALLGFFIDKGKYMDAAEGSWKPFKPFYVNGTPYGGLVGTRRGLVRYAQALLQADSPLLDSHYKRLLFAEHHTTAGNPTGMCLSWFTGLLNGQRFVTHAGGGGGYYCEVRLYPEAGWGNVILFNRTGMKDERLLDKV
ncbi:MAG TPA: serine hydrolase domain-containing protein [Chitinophagaceae bacterium]